MLLMEFHGTPASVREQAESVEALTAEHGGAAFRSALNLLIAEEFGRGAPIAALEGFCQLLGIRVAAGVGDDLYRQP